MNKTTAILAAVFIGAAVTLSGCPTAPGTFEVWVVNTSGQVTVTNVALVDNANAENTREFSADLAPNTARVSTNIPLGAFRDGTITVEITGETGGEVFEDVDAEVNIPDAIQSGSVLVIVVSGNSVLNFNAEYVPLEDASKGELMFRNHLLGAL